MTHGVRVMRSKIGLVFAALLFCPAIAAAAELQIASQGYLFAGGHYVNFAGIGAGALLLAVDHLRRSGAKREAAA